MSPSRTACLLAPGLLALVLLPPAALARPHQLRPETLAQRRQLAAQTAGRTKVHINRLGAAAAQDLATAMDVNPSQLVSYELSGPDGASSALTSLGIIRPIRGSSFAVLSTGLVGTVAEPGTDFGTFNGDQVLLTLVLSVPPGSSHLSFNYNFLSAEYPEFIGTEFNDTFTATLTDATGTRTVAEASVNSSVFFPASASRAGGSGFDLFTEDPDGVDTDFGTGLPDAGLTDFQSVDVPVQSNGTITLQFSIMDEGDGILDSAVILDNLNLASIEILDADDPSFLVGGNVTSNPESLSHDGAPRIGAAADGVTRLLLRSKLDGPGSVDWCLDGSNAPADGGLDVLGGDGRAQCVTAPVAQTSAGYQAFALYRAPDEFNRGGDENLDKRSIAISSTFHPSGGGATLQSRAQIQLVRPPLILVHGLWSDPGTWLFPLASDSRFSILPVNYRATNAAHFATNGAQVPAAIRDALDEQRHHGYAATQADVVGHSMGGILARIWATDPSFRREDNFNQGNIHKLITLDTPHTGSPLANVLIAAGNTPLIGSLFKAAMNYLEKPIDQGAVEDLQKQSPAIRSLAPVPVPAHALVGKGGSDLIGDIGSAGAELPGELGAFFTVLEFYGALSNVFPGLQHDLIVGRDSQEGGLPGNAFSVFGGGDGVHIHVPLLIAGNTGSTVYSDRVIQLLNSDAKGSLFSHFPGTAGLPDTASALSGQPRFQPYPAKSVQGGLQILSPASGSSVVPGQTIQVVIQPPSGVTLRKVLVIGRGVAEQSQQAPFSVSLKVPLDAIGNLKISAVGANASGDYFTSNEVSLLVTQTALLSQINLTPSEAILHGPGSRLRLSASGTYSDGVSRDVTAAETGTQYLTADNSIASVSPDGEVTAQAVGTTTIAARNGDAQDSVTVRVLPALAPCSPAESSLCLNQSRFRLHIQWQDFQGHQGDAHVVPISTTDSGLFWFFGADNWEVMAKVLDGCALNGRFWVFAAATTNVGYTLTVTDELTGQSKVYTNPVGQLSPAITDTDAFASCTSASQTIKTASVASAPPALPRAAGAVTSSCTADATHLCLGSGGRFKIEVTWRDFQGGTGSGTVVPIGSNDSGLFWFFNSQNWEMLVKIVNGCSLNARQWIFAAAVTNVQYKLRVTDTVTGQVKEYLNPLGTASPAIIDTSTFSGCS